MLHYVPILDYARRKNIRIVGLHPSDDLITAIEHGGLSSLSSTNATEIPVDGVEVDGNKVGYLPRDSPPVSPIGVLKVGTEPKPHVWLGVVARR